jgi:hypothetical protein
LCPSIGELSDQSYNEAWICRRERLHEEGLSHLRVGMVWRDLGCAAVVFGNL